MGGGGGPGELFVEPVFCGDEAVRAWKEVLLGSITPYRRLLAVRVRWQWWPGEGGDL